MKDQINTIREALSLATDGPIVDRDGTIAKALTALSNLESHLAQYEAGDMVSAAAQGFRDGVASVTQQPQADSIPVAAFDRLMALCESQAQRIIELEDKQPQAEAVPLTHVLVPVDEPTDEMVDAACAAVDGLCRVDFVRAYVAAFAHLKAGYRDESYWCGWNAAIKFQQAESAHQYNLANRLRVHLANRHTLTGPEFKDGVAGILAEYYTAPQQAEAVPFNHATQLQIAYVKGLGDGAMQAEAVPPDVEVIRKALERAFIMGQNYWADADSESYSANKRSDVTRQKFNAMRDEVCAAIAQQKGGV